MVATKESESFVEKSTSKAGAVGGSVCDLSGELKKRKSNKTAAAAATAAVDQASSSAVRASELASSEGKHYPGHCKYPQEHHSYPLPRGWKAVVDQSSGRTYYANPLSGASSWVPPAFYPYYSHHSSYPMALTSPSTQQHQHAQKHDSCQYSHPTISTTLPATTAANGGKQHAQKNRLSTAVPLYSSNETKTTEESRHANDVTSTRPRLPSAAASLAAFSVVSAQPKTLPEQASGRNVLADGATNSSGKSVHHFHHHDDACDDEYATFVRGLGLGEAGDAAANVLFEQTDDEEEDDDEEYCFLTNLEGDDDDDEEEEEDEETRQNNFRGSNSRVTDHSKVNASVCSISDYQTRPPKTSPLYDTKSTALDYLDDIDPSFYEELEEELGGLEEEDLEAAVASLLGTTSTSYAHAQRNGVLLEDVHGGHEPEINNSFREHHSHDNQKAENVGSDCGKNQSEPATPLRKATGARAQAVVTSQQVERLQKLLNRHYQALIQQTVLSIQAAYLNRTHYMKDTGDFLSGETYDDIVQILDTAVGMLQDLDQNRKDAIRNAIQLQKRGSPKKLSRVLDLEVVAKEKSKGSTQKKGSTMCAESILSKGEGRSQAEHRRLTRAAFSKSLEECAVGRTSVFNIRGLHRLKETFCALDLCHDPLNRPDLAGGDDEAISKEMCRRILQEAGADVEDELIPGNGDLSTFFSAPQEYFGKFSPKPFDKAQNRRVRKLRALLTSGEDNLVLRGVNLYGEKQWLLIVERYLPDRSVNTISQRYAKLCVMLYRANGISIDSDGNLEKNPKLESVGDIDDAAVNLIKKADPPAILNVHRWSLEEDLILLKAVPLMGHMWAEIGARLIPHRDRGHLRKRYQVLERRVKATVSRTAKVNNRFSDLAQVARQTRNPPQRPALSGSKIPSTSETSEFTKNPHALDRVDMHLTDGTAQSPRQFAFTSARTAAEANSHRTDSHQKSSSGTSNGTSHEQEQQRNDSEMIQTCIVSGATNMAYIIGNVAGQGGFSPEKEEITKGIGKKIVSTPAKENEENSLVLERRGEFATHVLDMGLSKEKSLETKQHLKRSVKSYSTRIWSNTAEGAGQLHMHNTSKHGTKRKSTFPPTEESTKRVERAEIPLNAGPGAQHATAKSPDQSALFAAADASRLDGLNFNTFESQHGGLAKDEVNRDCLSLSRISLLGDPSMEADAVSALNSLSSSPAQSFLNRPKGAGHTTVEAWATTTGAVLENNSNGKSLFSKAIEGIEERERVRKGFDF